MRGLYAITPAVAEAVEVLDYARQVLSGGAVVLQYRDKSSGPERLRVALELRALCQQHNALLIINDDIKLASQSGADGVHLGRDDEALVQARERLGAEAVIGISCYNDLKRARDAATAGADYLAFGSVYPSGTKPDAVRCPLSLLDEARGFGLPVVAIGGITLDNAPAVIRAGADMLAVIGDLATAADIRQRAGQYRLLWNTRRPT